ncbi:RNA polymerase factor sigma-54 [Anaerovorax odorimutans]|uniref:RNA polymerase factor sigma-54 n=1 Tax=Anaerovorax odorimutans TaxID=109327 RepID=A0ABT1RJJ0_9FIRM|nr:RNA polymerase factor sigma-54 [Anaerovorax odorimutans]MCQ4635348.1 RNA polymerase factor sigma-54 [Anaerovorax odorimutans]
MSMRLGYDLTIEQTQKLVMTPELIQAIQILQFNTQELDSYVQEQLLTNPVLEQGASAPGDSQEHREQESEGREETSASEKNDHDSEIDWKEYLKDRQYDDISYRQWEYKDPEEKENSYEQYTTYDVTLPEHLMFQLQFASHKKGCRNVGRYIIESLDENGYMTLTVEEISKVTGVPEDKIEEVLDIIHTFDPAGVGARDLRECLLIQMEHQGMLTDEYETVINEHLEDLAANRLGAISKSMGIPVKEIQEMADVIKSLEPKPGRQFATQTDTRYIVPDVLVERVDDDYVVTVNDSSTPHLMVSSYYEKLLGEAEKDSNLSKYLTDRLNSAVWLIKSIDQRKQTIYNVVKAVVKYQKEFFDKGSKYLRTLTLKQIAEEVGIHESTVSRSINGKYLQSPMGVFEIKYFFSGGVAGDQGEGISSKSIKSFIKEIVDSEDPKSPHSDQDMVKMLKDKGIDISRRTVAKYRDEMNILSSSKRRRY